MRSGKFTTMAWRVLAWPVLPRKQLAGRGWGIWSCRRQLAGRDWGIWSCRDNWLRGPGAFVIVAGSAGLLHSVVWGMMSVYGRRRSLASDSRITAEESPRSRNLHVWAACVNFGSVETPPLRAELLPFVEKNVCALCAGHTLFWARPCTC